MGDAAKQFALELNREWAEAQADIGDAVTLVALSAFKMILEKSPVDTGRFRGNWNIAVGSANYAYGPEDAIYNNTPSFPETRTAEAVTDLAGYGAGGLYPAINISNGLPYAVPLENGHSKQAPAGTVAPTVAYIEAKFDGWEI